MVDTVQTCRIYEMSSGRADLLKFAVHHFYEIFSRAANVPGKSHGTIVAGVDQYTAEQLSDGDLISDLETDDLGARLEFQIAPVDSDSLVHVSVFKCEDGCHDLCDRSRIEFFIYIFFI